MTASKISISWEDLNSAEVEQKIERQQAINQVRSHYQQAVGVPARKSGLLYNAAVYMALFGLAGGLLAWSFAESFSAVFPDHVQQIREITAGEKAIVALFATGTITESEKGARLTGLYSQYADNGYVAIITDWLLDGDMKKQMLEERWKKYQFIQGVRQIIWHAIIGVFLAVCLAIGDDVMSRNWRNAIINGSVAVLLGVVGAVVAGMMVNKLYVALGGDAVGVSWPRQLIARSIGWAILGMFLCLAPGVVLRSRKRMMIGVVGGFIGGLLGGMLFDPISVSVGSGWISRLFAVTSIGVIAGAGTGLLESVAKTGWLRVEKGLIAGKQFILYRNPTFIGSSPQCEIYLFNDREISPQHAAIHLLGGGFEIEDLNEDSQTTVNDRPVIRARLRSGDKIQIGSTRIVFLEKRQLPRLG